MGQLSGLNLLLPCGIGVNDSKCGDRTNLLARCIAAGSCRNVPSRWPPFTYTLSGSPVSATAVTPTSARSSIGRRFRACDNVVCR